MAWCIFIWGLSGLLPQSNREAEWLQADREPREKSAQKRIFG